VILLHFHRDDLPYKEHTPERYNYSSMHGNELVVFHVPQVLQQLCNVDQYFSIIQRLNHLYQLFHIYWLENFLDDGYHDLFSSFLTTNQRFVVAMQKLQFQSWKRHLELLYQHLEDVYYHVQLKKENHCTIDECHIIQLYK
jgi:hypothetical protein